jgi:YggT family protein
MASLIGFIFAVVQGLLTAFVWLVFIWVAMSWLVLFGVLNTRNRIARQIAGALDAVMLPIFRPARRILPPMGGMDFSPLVVMIVVVAAQRYLLPGLEGWLLSVTGS